MTGKRVLAFTLALISVLLVAAGCAKNPDDIMGMVGETPIYRWQFEAALKTQLARYETMMGIDLTQPQYEADYKGYKETQLNFLMGEAAMKEEARKQGLYELTAEQEAEIDAQYLKYYNEKIASFLEQYGSDEKGRRQAEQAYIDLLENSSLTPERMRYMMRDAYVVTLLYDQLQPAGSITEESIRDYYDKELAAQQAGIASSPTWFGENTPDPILAAPEGYVETVRIALDFTQKQRAEINAAADLASKAQADYKKNESGLLSGIKKDTFDRAMANFERVLNDAYAQLDTQLNAIRDEALGGADFIKLMEQKSEDNHLISYFVSKDSTHVELAYVDAALALANVGDISSPVHLKDGSCIIQLKEKIAPGVRSFDEVYDQIQTKLKSNTRSNATLVTMQAEFAEKAQQAGIVTLYPEKL